MKVKYLIGILVSTLFVGCSNPSWAENMPTELPVANNPTVGEPPMYANWISPPKVTVSNFHSGATASYPITFHNAKITATDTKRVTTGEKETVAEIPINSAGLYENNIQNVIAITSDNPQDSLMVTAYDSHVNAFIISGFAPSATRIMSVTYRPLTAYSVYYKFPDTSLPTETAKVAQEWVIVAEPTLVMYPLETRQDEVTISMPFGATVFDKTWEFWIGVSEITNGSLSYEWNTRWVINMKG